MILFHRKAAVLCTYRTKCPRLWLRNFCTCLYPPNCSRDITMGRRSNLFLTTWLSMNPCPVG